MKMKNKIISGWLAALMTATTANAAIINTPVEVDNKDAEFSTTVTITGTIDYFKDNAKSSQEVTMQIHKTETGDVYKDKSTLIYTDQAKISNADGDYEFVFKNKQSTGKYYITVSTSKAKDTFVWNYVSPADVANLRSIIFEAYKEADKVTALKKALNDCTDLGYIEFSVWNSCGIFYKSLYPYKSLLFKPLLNPFFM